MRRHLILPLFALVACAKPEPAPQDIDGLMRWFFENHAALTEVEHHDAISSLEAAIDAAGGESEKLDGSLNQLTEQQIAAVPVEGADPTSAFGLFLTRPVACTMAQLEPILYARDQNALYDAYKEYSREYTTDLEAYETRTAPTLNWDISLTAANILFGEYSEDLRGGIRWLGTNQDGRPAVIQHTYMPWPATFVNDKSRFDQDYQIEIFWQRDEAVHHAYGIWRDVHFNGVSTVEDDIVARTILTALSDWDDITERWCADGLPAEYR
jgi:hypothetical protein